MACLSFWKEREHLRSAKVFGGSVSTRHLRQEVVFSGTSCQKKNLFFDTLHHAHPLAWRRKQLNTRKKSYQPRTSADIPNTPAMHGPITKTATFPNRKKGKRFAWLSQLANFCACKQTRLNTLCGRKQVPSSHGGSSLGGNFTLNQSTLALLTGKRCPLAKSSCSNVCVNQDPN